MRKTLSLLLSVVLLTFLAPFTPFAHAVDPLQAVLDCSTSNPTFCIDSIYVIKSDGTRVKGFLNGKTDPEIRSYAPASVLKANWQEYEFPGVTFDGGNVKSLYPRIFYYPLGNQDCFYTPCVNGAEYLETVLTPGYRTALGPNTKFMPQVSESCVGKTYYPGSPWPAEFGPGVSFELNLRIPSEVLRTLGSGGLGRALSSASTALDFSNSQYATLNMKLTPSETSSYGCAGATLAPHADFEFDQPTYWIWGLSDIRMSSFGRCESIKSGVSVVSNAFWDNFPVWDSANSSINVSLSGPHYKSDGSINNVNFQAKISTALAQCLWGIDLTHQAKAQISLLYDQAGQTQTQSYTGQLVNDQYVVNVTGIHLSSPTLSLKFVDSVTPDQTPSATPAPSASPKPSPVKTTINCVKGKLIRKVTAFSPSCPAGYKKK
jgi:hypothetical protein